MASINIYLYRAEQESLLRTEADDRCHSLRKKLEFTEQVHAQQVAELRERMEQSQATVISLESRLGVIAKNDVAIPDILKQVREQAQFELKRYQVESEENYNRNVGFDFHFKLSILTTIFTCLLF